MKFPNGFKSPIKYEVYIEKFERGIWNRAVLNRKGDDFCGTLRNPVEPWYDLFSKFQKRGCPYPPGYVETFKNLKVAGAPENIPATFIGKYRIMMKYTFIEKTGGSYTDCSSLSIEVADV